VWRIEHEGSSDIALTEEDAMAIIGEWLKAGYESGRGGEFKILWDGVPFGFQVPDLELIFTEHPSRSH
jgi:hypothetical protein